MRDWILLDWPYQLVLAYFDPHHYYYIGMGPAIWAIGALLFVLGAILSLGAGEGRIREIMSIKWLPISQSWIDQEQSKGVLNQLLVLPLDIVNLVYSLFYKIICIALYWHFIFAIVLTMIVTLNGRIGYELSESIEKILIVLVIIAPVVTIVIRTFELFLII